MPLLNTRAVTACLVLAGLGWASLSAWAYIPPASFILHEVAKKHLAFTTIRVRSHVIGLDGNGNPNGVRLREITFVNSKDGTLRSWITDESGKVLYTVERVSNASSKSSKMPVAAEMLFDTNSVRMASVLRSVGVQIPVGKDANLTDENTGGDKLSLHRWNRSVAWVLGKTAQLWIEKDTFIPMRVIAPPRGDSQLYDFQMENFKYYDEYAYPRLGTLFEVGKKAPVLKTELMDIILDPNVSGAELPKERGEGFTEAGQSAPSQVRELIETYYRLIR
jgi:hypothetical protein